MENLSNYSELAEIFSATTIIFGSIFALVQFREYKKRQKIEMASEMCRQFSEPGLARAITLLLQLPDDTSYETLKSMDIEYEESAQIVGHAFESMGLLVHIDVASFNLIQSLAGGLMLTIWKKLHCWVEGTREFESNPRFAEWVEWLVNQVESEETILVPAYIAYKDWKHK